MKAKTLAIAMLCATALSSCIHQLVIQSVTREAYPGDRPPHVIADNNGTPAGGKWLANDPAALPPSSSEIEKIKYHADGLPYGIPSNYAGIITSPYSPYNVLDCQNTKPNQKVWDPYTRKPFYIPRTYTFN